jgi:peptide/nickel transport system permease protein
MSLESSIDQYNQDVGYPYPLIAKYLKRFFYLIGIVLIALGAIILSGVYLVDFKSTPIALIFNITSLPTYVVPSIYMIIIGVLTIFISRFIWAADRDSHLLTLALAVVLIDVTWPIPFASLISIIFACMLVAFVLAQVKWPINADYLVKLTIALLFIIGLAEIMFGLIILAGNAIYFIYGFFGIVEPPAYLGLYLFHSLFSIVIGAFTIQLVQPIREKEPSSFSWTLYLAIPSVILFLLIPAEIGFPLLFANIATLMFVALSPQVRALWITEFLEDMGPRLKETRYSLYLIRKSPLVVVGIIIIVGFVFIAIFAGELAPYGPEQRIWSDVAEAPSPKHIWGTDEVGGDVYSRILWASQTDLRIALTVVAVAVILGTIIGASSGYYGGKLDEIVMRITDVFFAFPGLILAMAIVMAIGERNLDSISIALMITWWPTYARLVRGQVLSEREKLYVEASRSVGASDSRILFFHIIPNTIQPMIVQSTMDIGAVLLTAAGLSYIGFGANAGAAEWGLMISTGQQYLLYAPWMSVYPGIAILLVALAFNLVGDGIRDILDPKLRRR